MEKITKKEVKEKMTTTKVGFSTYRYHVSFGEKSYSAHSEEGNVTNEIGLGVGHRISNKKEFVDVVFENINS